MPYRNAHWWLLGLFPLIAVAFWPNYLGKFGAAPFALHAHGMTAGTWLALLTVQSWSAHRRLAWHRRAGLASFVALPLFAAAGPLALWSMIGLYAVPTDPFHGAYGARLAWSDIVSGPAVIGLVVYAVAQRRTVRVHAAAMLATALLVLPPVLGRLTNYVPGFPADGAFGTTNFELSFQVAEAIALGIALILARAPAARPAFLFVAAVTMVQMVGFATIGRTAWWDAFVRSLLAIPVAPVSVAAGVAAAALLWAAWRRVPPRPTAATGSIPAAA